MKLSTTTTNWDELRQHADAYLKEQGGTCDQFRGAIQPLFEKMWERTKRPVTRRPNIGLRLIVDGEPLAKLVVLPYWSPHTKTVLCDQLYVELMVERATTTSKGEAAKQWTRQVTASVKSNPCKVVAGLIRPSALEDLRRVACTMESFLSDKNRVMARSHDWCCCCGRPLTDELSRSRGIGPECIQLADFGVWLTTQSVIVEEVAS